MFKMSAVSSETFENLEDEFRSYLEELQNVIKNKIPKLIGEPRKREIRNAGKFIEDADLQLTLMVDEAQSAPGAYRTNLMSKTRGYRSQLDKNKKELEKLKSTTVNSPLSGREDLLGSPSGYNDPNIAQRNKIAEGLEIMNRSSNSVARSQRIAVETEEIGVNITNDLGDQRETLIRISEKTKQTDSDLTKSRRILNSMAIRLATNKIILVVIIIVELAILGAIIYLRFVK